MNKKALLIAFFLCAPFISVWADEPVPAAATSALSPSHVQQLKWLDSTDPDKMFQADLKKNLYHFYVVCGLSCEPPGLNKLDAVQCFPAAKLFRMAGTTDALDSEEDGVYQEKAVKFARRYNIQLLEYLSKHGMTDCVVGESWTDALSEMRKRLADQEVKSDSVDIAYSKETHKFRFSTHVSTEKRNQNMEGLVCFIALEHHLSGKVILEVYDDDGSAPPSSVECRYGEAMLSDWKPKPSDYPYESLED